MAIKYLSFLFHLEHDSYSPFEPKSYLGFDVVMPQIQAMADDIQPLIAEVHNNGFLTEVKTLTKSLTVAFEELRLLSISPMV